MLLYFIHNNMHIFNEYIHVDAKHKLDDEWIVTYEPPDHPPSDRSFMGLIVADDISTAFRISSTNGRVAKLSFHDDGIDRGFMWDDGAIEMVWKEDPGEHFLCISYRTKESDPTYRDRNKNWLQEGF